MTLKRPPYFRWIRTEGSVAPRANRRHFGSFFSSQGITFFPYFSNSLFFPSYLAGSYRPPFCEVFSIPVSIPLPLSKGGVSPHFSITKEIHNLFTLLPPTPPTEEFIPFYHMYFIPSLVVVYLCFGWGWREREKRKTGPMGD